MNYVEQKQWCPVCLQVSTPTELMQLILRGDRVAARDWLGGLCLGHWEEVTTELCKKINLPEGIFTVGRKPDFFILMRCPNCEAKVPDYGLLLLCEHSRNLTTALQHYAAVISAGDVEELEAIQLSFLELFAQIIRQLKSAPNN